MIYKFIASVILFLFLTVESYSKSVSAIDSLPNNLVDLRESIYSNIPDSFKFDRYPRASYRYADISAISLQQILANGAVYRDWAKAENYLNDILRTIMPEELMHANSIKCVLLKDGSYNASISASGLIFVNVGLLAEVDDESTLAGVLTHELAHYYLKHSIKGFVKSKEGDFDTGLLFAKQKKLLSSYSVNSELEADSMAFHWMSSTNYNLSGLEKAFQLGKLVESNEIAKYSNQWNLEETTHPSSERRINKLKNYGSSTFVSDGKEYVVSEQSFKEIQRKAKTETLYYLLNDFKYLECIEKAFVYHLYDIKNGEYVYYLMEAIRRVGYLDTKFWSEYFISFQYYKEISYIGDKERKKARYNDHIFTEFPNELLTLPSNAFSEIQAKFYWNGDHKFETNEQAFVYFSNIAKKYNNNECILSDALSVFFKKDLLDVKLKEYLSKDSIKYRDFASDLLNGTLVTNLSKRKLTVINNLITGVRQGKEMITVVEKGKDDQDFLISLIEDVSLRVDNRKFVFLSDIRESNPELFDILNELERFSFSSILAAGNQSELTLLDPRYWALLRDLNVNEIEFVNSRYIDTRKREFDLDSYKEVSELGVAELINEVKRNRYYQLLISSVRSEKEKRMKTFYLSKEEKLSYKNNVKSELVEFIVNKLKDKDVKLAEFDSNK